MRLKRLAAGGVMLCVLALAWMAGAGRLAAADFFLLPSGGGLRDGTSWESAFAQESLETVINERLRPGDRLLIGGGRYAGVQLSVRDGGLPEAPKTLLGVDRGEGWPVFVGDWQVEDPEKGATAIRIEAGASHLSIENLRIESYARGVHAPQGGAPRAGLIFRNVNMRLFRYGFFLSDCDDVQFIDCDLRRYTKHAFRFEEGCDRMRLQNCVADCTDGDDAWEEKTELFPFGFNVTANGSPNTNLVFEDCVARHNRMREQPQKYKNGDGFVVEGNATNVSFQGCRAIRNQDGGFDLKTRDVRLVDCVAVGNYRGFRIWTTGKLQNCFAGWGTAGIWFNEGPIEVIRSTFFAMSNAAVQAGDKAQAAVTLNDCLIAECAETFLQEGGGTIETRATIETDTPEFVKPDANWDGEGDAMDSRAFPEAGYRDKQTWPAR